MQINPVIYYPLPLPDGNYMRLPNNCPNINYLHISTTGTLADSYVSASDMKSPAVYWIKHPN